MFWRIVIGCCVVILVAMVTSVLCASRASSVCGDESGYNCLFQSNEEEFSDVPVQFDNALPSWLSGTLFRNGVGLFERGHQSVTHVFDGFAKLSSWKIYSNGTSLFSTRFIRSSLYQDTKNSNHIAPYILFSPPDPPFGLFQKKKCLLNGLDNMNINIFDFPNEQKNPKFAAFSDYWNVYQMSGHDLSTLDYIKPTLQGGESLFHVNMMASGHPLPEPGTTNRLTYLVRQKTLSFFNNRLSLVRMSSVSERTLIAEWKIKETVPYMHSFSVTQTKAILVTGPVTVDNNCFYLESAPLPCMKWQSDKTSTLYIADFKTGEKKTITMSSALFAIHHINAYDVSKDVIIMDVVSYDDSAIIDKMLMMDVVKNEQKRNDAFIYPRNRRVEINMASGIAKVQDMSTLNAVCDGLDMPAINEQYRSQDYCFVYGMNNFADGFSFRASAIIKKDMCNNGSIAGTVFIPDHYPVEPAFVPNPDGTEEDDGVLLVPFLRGYDAVTYLSVVDAKTMTIISKADMPTYIPFSLHGRFFKDYF